MHQPKSIRPKTRLTLNHHGDWTVPPPRQPTRDAPRPLGDNRTASDADRAAPPAAGPGIESLAELARRTLHARQLRRAYLPEAMFGEPAWDMMLALYQGQHQARHHIKRLCSASGAPPTTALRWIEYLVEAGLVTRRASPVDKRVVFIELTAAGLHAIEKYLVDLRGSGVLAAAIRSDHGLARRQDVGVPAE